MINKYSRNNASNINSKYIYGSNNTGSIIELILNYKSTPIGVKIIPYRELGK